MPVNEKIVVDSDGILFMSVDGVLTCTDQKVIARARKHSTLNTLVRLYDPFGEQVKADLTDYENNKIGFVAAMIAANPGRSLILEAPADIMEWLEKDQEEHGEDLQYQFEDE